MRARVTKGESEGLDGPAERERRLIEAARRRASSSAASRRFPGLDVGTAPHPDFPGYRVLNEADRGGQGVVFRAVQESTGRVVAIKMLRGGALAGPSSRARVEREVSILAQLDDEGLCPVIDFIADAAQVFVVMPFIEGENLSKGLERAAELRRGGASAELAWRAIAGAAEERERPARADGLRAALGVIEDVARSLHAAHERGIVHRDLKPGNVMLRPARRPVVLDFGLALDLSADEAARFTPSGEPVGTPAYMAPEQLHGEGALIDRRTDVYALGALLYELLSFRRPFSGSGLVAMCHDIATGRFERPRAHEPAVPEDLEAVCLKALDLDPAQRYATSLELARDLARFRAGEATLARPLPAWRRALRVASRHRVATVATLASLALLWLVLRPVSETVFPFPAQPTLAECVRALWSAAPVAPELHARAAELIGDERALELLVGPATTEALDALIAAARERFPAAGSTRPRIEPIAPRAAVIDERPDFRFEVAAPADFASDVAVYELRLFDAEGELFVLPIARIAGESAVLSAALGPDQRLERGVEYGWTVTLRGRGARPLWRTARATFRVVDPALAAERLNALPGEGSPAVTSLARAATLLSLELAAEARDELRPLGRNDEPEVQRRRALLACVAAALLGDEEALANERARFHAHGDGLSGAER